MRLGGHNGVVPDVDYRYGKPCAFEGRTVYVKFNPAVSVGLWAGGRFPAKHIAGEIEVEWVPQVTLVEPYRVFQIKFQEQVS